VLLADGIGYVALTIFSKQSAVELESAVDSLKTAGMKSLLLDLRGDPGGLLEEGVGVADLFLDQGQTIVSLRGRTITSPQFYYDRAPQRWPDLPVTLLVDGGSASASEIVTGALQDHDRALVLGTTTYGKGSAQNVFAMPNGGAVKLTTALWYTPSGRSINKKPASDTVGADTSMAKRPKFKTDAGRKVLGGGGITPDIVIPARQLSASDSALVRAIGKNGGPFNDALADYALSLKGSKGVSSPEFAVTPAMRAEVLRRMRARGAAIDSAALAAAVPSLDRQIAVVIDRYVFGDLAGFRRALADDPTVNRAVAIIHGASTEQALLERATPAAAR
jgi:carboxyl-terminal processing protease